MNKDDRLLAVLHGSRAGGGLSGTSQNVFLLLLGTMSQNLFGSAKALQHSVWKNTKRNYQTADYGLEQAAE